MEKYLTVEEIMTLSLQELREYVLLLDSDIIALEKYLLLFKDQFTKDQKVKIYLHSLIPLQDVCLSY